MILRGQIRFRTGMTTEKEIASDLNKSYFNGAVGIKGWLK